MFDALADEALAAYDRIIGLDLAEVATDGSQHTAPCGGEGTGPNCTDFEFVRQDCAERGLVDVQIPKCRKRKSKGRAKKKPIPLGLRWPVERTNSWLSNFGQLRRNTDPRIVHRHAQLQLAIVFLLAAKLIDWARRWSPIRQPSQLRGTSFHATSLSTRTSPGSPSTRSPMMFLSTSEVPPSMELARARRKFLCRSPVKSAWRGRENS